MVRVRMDRVRYDVYRRGRALPVLAYPTVLERLLARVALDWIARRLAGRERS
jgi:hypothetical protein